MLSQIYYSIFLVVAFLNLRYTAEQKTCRQLVYKDTPLLEKVPTKKNNYNKSVIYYYRLSPLQNQNMDPKVSLMTGVDCIFQCPNHQAMVPGFQPQQQIGPSKILFCFASTTNDDLHVGAFLAVVCLVVGDRVIG